MNEEDTYKRLVGRSFEEVKALYDITISNVCLKNVIEEGRNGSTHMEIKAIMEPIIRPYGWTYERFMRNFRKVYK